MKLIIQIVQIFQQTHTRGGRGDVCLYPCERLNYLKYYFFLYISGPYTGPGPEIFQSFKAGAI
jgi:hypothetical protein